MVRKKGGGDCTKKNRGQWKEENQDGGCNRRRPAGGLFTVTEGDEKRDGEAGG